MKGMKGGRRKETEEKNNRDDVTDADSHTQPHVQESAVLITGSAGSLKAAVHLGWPLPFSHTHTHTHSPFNQLYRCQCVISAPAGPVGDAKLTIICIGSNQHEGRAAIHDINSTGLSVSRAWGNMTHREELWINSVWSDYLLKFYVELLNFNKQLINVNILVQL